MAVTCKKQQPSSGISASGSHKPRQHQDAKLSELQPHMHYSSLKLTNLSESGPYTSVIDCQSINKPVRHHTTSLG